MRHRPAPILGLAALLVFLGGSDGMPAARAQQPAAAAAALETIKIRDNVYAITGAGGNVTVHIGPEGVILVDSGTAAAATQVVAAVMTITAQPIRLVINTSADADHVGGNATLAAAGYSVNPNAFDAGTRAAAVLAHENVLLRMSAPSGQASPFPIAAWPTETFTARSRSMYLNDDGIQVIRQPAAHTDGDSIVFFRRVDVIATGDIVDFRRFPHIDVARGGTVQGEIDALNRLLELAIPAMPLIYKEARTHLVPGHGRVADHADLVEYRDMVTVVRDIVLEMVKKGMTLAQVQAANPTQGYRVRYGSDSGAWTTAMFVEAIYNELTSTGGKS